MTGSHATCDDAIAALIDAVREEATRGPVRPRVVLFVEESGGWRTIVIDGGGELDAEGPRDALETAVREVAEALAPEATAIVQEWPLVGAHVSVGWRDASGDLYQVGRGRHAPIATRLTDVLRDDADSSSPPDSNDAARPAPATSSRRSRPRRTQTPPRAKRTGRSNGA